MYGLQVLVLHNQHQVSGAEHVGRQLTCLMIRELIASSFHHLGRCRIHWFAYESAQTSGAHLNVFSFQFAF